MQNLEDFHPHTRAHAATPAELERLQAHFDLPIPTQALHFLQQLNGGTLQINLIVWDNASIAIQQFFSLSDLRELLHHHQRLHPLKTMPALLPFARDGENHLFALDLRDGSVLYLHFLHARQISVIWLAESFQAFLKRLSGLPNPQ